MRKLLYTTIILFCVSCTDQDLTRVAKAISEVDQGILIVAQTAAAANQAGLLSDTVTDKIMSAVIKIGPPAKEANQLVRSLNTLDPASRVKLKELMNPLIQVASDIANDPAIVGVTNPNTQVSLKATLTGVLTSLTIIKGIL